MKKYKYTINGNVYEVTIGDISDNVADVNVNGEDYKVEMEPEKKPEKPKPVVRPAAGAAAPAASNAQAGGGNAGGKTVKAPLPGVITEVKVAVGDEVNVGDTCIVLEAMKMANNLETEYAGKVKEICVQPGQSVMEDDVLVVIE